MAGNAALQIEHILLRIDAGSDIDHHQFSRMRTELRRVLAYGQRMQIHHAVIAFIFVGQTDPVLQGSEIVAQGQIAGCLHAAVEYLVIFVHCFISPVVL